MLIDFYIYAIGLRIETFQSTYHMIPEFDQLTEEEVAVLAKAPVWVSLLIAGADNKIDGKELDKAVAISKMKQSRAREALLDYYQQIGPGFEKELRSTAANLESSNKEDCLKEIETQLSKLNDILPKVEEGFARALIASLKDIARKIAEASGGIFGYGSIGYEESKVVGLPMIKNI